MKCRLSSLSVSVALFDTLHLVLVEIFDSEALATRDFTNGRPKLRMLVYQLLPELLFIAVAPVAGMLVEAAGGEERFLPSATSRVGAEN